MLQENDNLNNSHLEKLTRRATPTCALLDGDAPFLSLLGRGTFLRAAFWDRGRGYHLPGVGLLWCQAGELFIGDGLDLAESRMGGTGRCHQCQVILYTRLKRRLRNGNQTFKTMKQSLPIIFNREAYCLSRATMALMQVLQHAANALLALNRWYTRTDDKIKLAGMTKRILSPICVLLCLRFVKCK